MSYIEDDFQRELDAWDPARARRIKPHKKLLRRDALVAALALHAPTARRDTLALFDLYAAGELPQNSFCDFCLGYTLVEDLGESMGRDLESSPASQDLGAASVGLADDGCGMRYFVGREGAVHLLDLSEMPYRWQHLPDQPDYAFASVDIWCWALFQALLVDEGAVASEVLIERSQAKGCYSILRSTRFAEEW
ncbi:MAG: hypothetical protein AB8H86_32560 [Polyangiales bacterium]